MRFERRLSHFRFLMPIKTKWVHMPLLRKKSHLFVSLRLCLQNGLYGEGWQRSECKIGAMGLSLAHVVCSDTHQRGEVVDRVRHQRHHGAEPNARDDASAIGPSES